MDNWQVIGENSGAGTAIAAPFQAFDVEAIDHMENPAKDRTTPTSLYRYYDDFGVLIYVGVTQAGTTRNRQHNSDKAWWQWVASQKVDHFTFRAEALKAEAELIGRLRPPFNKQHNPNHAALSAAYAAARNGDQFWAAKLTQIGYAKPPALPMSVARAEWKQGDVELIAGDAHLMLAARVTFSEKRPPVITHDAAHVIGSVYAVEHVGITTIVRLRIKRGWRFRLVEVDLKRNGPFIVIKKVVAMSAQCEKAVA